MRLNGEILSLDEEIPPLDRQKWHNIEIVVDRITTEKSERSPSIADATIFGRSTIRAPHSMVVSMPGS